MSIEQRLEEMTERFIELETRLAYQEELIAALNQEVALQQQKAADLEKMNALLIDRYRELRDGIEQVNPPLDEKPPHY